MANFSTYARIQMLRGCFTPDWFTAPSDLQLALTTQVPLVNASVEELVEPTQGGYGRCDYQMGSAWWAETGFGELYNLAPVYFPTVLSSWGTMFGWALVDIVANQCWVTGGLLKPFIADVGMTPVLGPGVLTIGLYDD
jgi:hypothetical protein